MIKKYALMALCVFTHALQARILYSTVYVFSPDLEHVLLHFHKRLHRWMPPGGKIDAAEFASDTAIRECFEETGVHVRLISPACKGSVTVSHKPQPEAIEHYDGIGESGYAVEGYDFIYAAIASIDQELHPGDLESKKMLWVPVKAVLEGSFIVERQEYCWISYLYQKYAPKAY